MASGVHPVGGEILVSQSEGLWKHGQPLITTLPDERFLIVWQESGIDGTSIHGRTYNQDGTAAGSDFVIASSLSQVKGFMGLATLPDGKAVVAWFNPDANSDPGLGFNDIFARIINPDGTPSSPEFVINSTTSGGQVVPSITVLADGRFVVSWTSEETSSEVRARVFNADGTPVSDDFVLTTSAGNQHQDTTHPIAALPDGGFAATWSSDETGATSIRAQTFHTDGTAAGPEIVVDDPTGGHITGFGTIAVLANGRFVVSWSSDEANDSNVRARVFNADGTPVTDDFVVSTVTEGYQRSPSVVTLPDGRFVVTWVLDGVSLHGRIFNANGTAAGDEFVLSNTPEVREFTGLLAQSDGGFVATWESYDPDLGQFSIVAQVFALGSVSNSPPTDVTLSTPSISENATDGTVVGTLSAADPDIGDTFSFTLVNNAGGRFALNGDNKVIVANGSLLDFEQSQAHQITVEVTDSANNRVTKSLTISLINVEPENIVAGGGNDVITTGNGNSVINAGEGNNTVTTGTGNDIIQAGSGNNVINAGDGNNTVTTGAGADTVTTGGGNDVIRAGGGNNVINAGGGNDVVVTGSGSDSVTTGDGNDLAQTGAGADTIIGGKGAGNDVYDGGPGSDTVVYSSATHSIVVDLNEINRSGQPNLSLGTLLSLLDNPASFKALLVSGPIGPMLTNAGYAKTTPVGLARGSDIDTDALIGIDNVVGGQGADLLIGNGNANVLEGGAGKDLVSGGAGNDTFMSRAGDGNDLYLGGIGADMFVFRAGFGKDIIADFQVGTAASHDTLDLRGLGFATVAQVLAHTDHGANAVIHVGIDTITLHGVSWAQLNSHQYDLLI
jgi:Ca2+-binding RTX toxin-like protein